MSENTAATTTTVSIMKRYATTLLLWASLLVGEVHTFWEDSTKSENWIIGEKVEMPIQWNLKYAGDEVIGILIALAIVFYNRNRINETAAKVSDDNIYKTVMDKIIFARLKPEHKLRIIKTLKKEKIYTAMIGDGVNDLPAIKESDMGIAMEEGSSITKEVADIVLLKNKFSLLPQIFDEGNKIVNTVNSIGKLFVTKNFFIIFITLMSLFFLLDFPLTPRRVSLINIFGIGLPAFIISLKNMNTDKTLNFMKDLISFVILSALIIVASGYTGIYIVQKYHEVSEKDIQMVMLTIMVITNIANYFSIVLTKKETQENRLIYILYGFIIMLIYIFLSASSFNPWILNIIKKFYELDFVRQDLWPVIMAVSVAGSIVLFAAQKFRAKYISDLNNKL